MNNEILEVAERISSLREMEDITIEDMAKATGKTSDEYQKYENGEKDFSFSFLYTVANRLGVDITALLTGDNAKLKKYEYVHSGDGLKTERRKAYKYQHLAPIFQERHMEPLLVTVEPKDVEAVIQHAHEGHELNYVIDGSMTIFIEDTAIFMNPGDSIYFNASTPHAMRAENGKPCKFLAVISK